MPLIHATARSGNLDVLELLLERYMVDASVTDKKNRTILHWLARVSGNKPGDKERIDSCFRLVLNSCKNKIIDMKENLGNTALYIAVKSGFKDRVLFLLKRGADIMLPINGTPVLSSFSTPMLEEFLGDCLQCNDEPENSKDLKLTFKYEILRKITPHMAEHPHQQELLKHPVASCFTNLHYVHMTECIFIKVFLSFISVLLLGIVLSKQSFVLLFPLYEVITSICLIFLSNFRNIRYFHTWEDFLSSPMTFWLILSRLDLLNSPEIWPHMLVISVLLAWLKHVLMIGQLPFMAVEMEMFKSVCRTFLQFMVGCSILLETLALAILISFYASLEQDGDSVMSEILHSFLKTISMFTSESEISKTPFKNLPVTSHVIFVLVSLASIILLIISIGLAVFDTQKLRRYAETQTAVARVRVIKDVNNWQECFRLNEIKEGKLTVYPNRWKPPFPHILSALVDLPCFSLCIRRKRQPSRTPQQTEEKLTAMENKLKEIQETLNKIATVHDIKE
jgi:hypothetical protein